MSFVSFHFFNHWSNEFTKKRQALVNNKVWVDFESRAQKLAKCRAITQNSNLWLGLRSPSQVQKFCQCVYTSWDLNSGPLLLCFFSLLHHQLSD